MTSKIDFECGKGHVWNASPASVMLSGTWCPFCMGSAKLDISEFNKIAISYGGQCLSTHYNTQQDKLEFCCKNNHIWKAAAKHIRAGHWCPHCHINFGEEICRDIFESIFNKPFPKCRPEWLFNDCGYRLELDGFSEELNIAFEHQGKQHYGIDIFGVGEDAMLKIKQNDTIKREICKNRGVYLIEIPQIFELTKPKELPAFLRKSFSKYDIKCYSLEKLLSINISRKKYNTSNA